MVRKLSLLALLCSAAVLSSAPFSGAHDDEGGGRRSRERRRGLTGAIFTTDVTGSLVNGNIYEDSTDVYLNGGPAVARARHGDDDDDDDGREAGRHRSAAGLPDGRYFFQVTNPSGRKLLSFRPVVEREFEVVDGYIQSVTGSHVGVGLEPPFPPNYTIVQLFPFLPTDNRGREYKVWVTPVQEYKPGKGSFGFLSRSSKTDNFKVRSDALSAALSGSVFRDQDLDGVWDVDECAQASIQVNLFQGSDPNPIDFTFSGTTGAWGFLVEPSSLPMTYAVGPAFAQQIDVVLAPTTPPLVAVTITTNGQSVEDILFGTVRIGDSGSGIRLSPDYFARGSEGEKFLAQMFPDPEEAWPPLAAEILAQPQCAFSSPSLSEIPDFLGANGNSSDVLCRMAANWLSLNLGIRAHEVGIEGPGGPVPDIAGQSVFVGLDPATGDPVFMTLAELLARVEAGFAAFSEAEIAFYASALQQAALNFSFVQPPEACGPPAPLRGSAGRGMEP